MDKSKPTPSSLQMLPINAEATSSTDPGISCSVCKCTEGRFANITNCDELKSLRDQLLVNSTIKVVSHACLNCLYKLYAVVEQCRIKGYRKFRNHRLSTVGKLIVETGGDHPKAPSSESSSSSNSSIIPDEQIFEREFVGGKNIQMEDEYNNDSEEDEVGGEEVNMEREEITCNKINGGQEEDEKEKAEAETDTEAEAGKEDHHNGKFSDHSNDLDIMYEHSESALVSESGGNPDQYKPQPQRCLYCSKTFVRQKMYNRHLRSHASQLRSRSMSSSKSRGRPNTTRAIYKCDDCPTTFSSAQLLRKHSKIHLIQHGCKYCHLFFFTISERDFHQAECLGKEMAKASTTMRSTRSYTRSIAARSIYAESNKYDVISTPNTKTSCRSRSSRISKTTDRTSTTYDDEVDDEVSVSCTDNYSLVQSWVNKTCRMSEIADEPPLVLSQKEYDIVMLERLIEQSERLHYTCTFIDCDYATLSLRDLSLHEILIHKSKTHYSCRKCRGVFTSKLFLDYHIYIQNYGEYHCNKCSMTFIYEYKLQHHLLQHQQHESFPCLYCNSSYMSETELRIHAIETGHDTNKRKKTISIDRTMTITNKTEPEPPAPKRVYQCTTNILVLPKTKIKPSLHAICRKYANLFIGDLDYEYEPGRNCVRTK